MDTSSKNKPIDGPAQPEDSSTDSADGQGRLTLNERDLLLSEFLDGTFEAIMTISPDHRIKVFNKGAERIFGYSADEIIDQPIDILIPTRSRAEHGNHVTNFKRSKDQNRLMDQRGEIKGLKKDGTEFPAEASISKLGTGDDIMFTIILRDITRRKASEEAARKSEAAFRTLLEGFKVACIVHQDGKLVFVNRAAARMHGYELEEIADRPITDFIATEDAPRVVANAEARARGAALPDQYEYQGLKKDGTIFTVDLKPQTIMWDGRSAILSALTDVSERKRAELDLQLATRKTEEAYRAKDEFLANMNHELRTPLNAVIGFSDMICNEMNGPLGNEKYRAYIQEIYASGTHLLSLVNDILDLAKIEAGKAELFEEEVDVAETVSACWRMVAMRAEEAGLDPVTQLHDDLSCLYGDKRAVKQIVLNLLSNAVKFTPHGGQVTVRTELDEDGCFLLSVSDTGIGIADEDIEKVLIPFGQVEGSSSQRQKGTGLGLPLVKSLAELHGGSFRLESEPGVGTTATIRFPANRVLFERAGISAGA